jgi:hypothetical protein
MAIALTNHVRIAELESKLVEIGRLAMECWIDMQGRLLDDEHRRAHGVLGSIVKQVAASSIPSEV